MASTDASKQLDDLVATCESDAVKSHSSGRKYYFMGYTIIVLAVGASILAGIFALWPNVPRQLVGTVALIPALCATLAGQLRLVEKANWFYRRRREMTALARTVDAARLRSASVDTLDTCTAKFAELDRKLGEEWERDLSFSFSAASNTGKR